MSIVRKFSIGSVDVAKGVENNPTRTVTSTPPRLINHGANKDGVLY